MRRKQGRERDSEFAILACCAAGSRFVAPGVREEPGATMFLHYGPLLMLTVTFAVYAPATWLAGTVSWKSGV